MEILDRLLLQSCYLADGILLSIYLSLALVHSGLLEPALCGLDVCM